jgi:putative Holliday junction resolvase
LGRILAIDYGKKRVGLAVTDPLKIIGSALTAVATHELFTFLKSYLEKEQVEKLIVGLPRQMNNSPSESMPDIQRFVTQFKKLYPEIPVQMVDERFTSKMAVQTMVMGGVKKKDRQNKALIDTVSAAIILQSYLESESYKR